VDVEVLSAGEVEDSGWEWWWWADVSVLVEYLSNVVGCRVGARFAAVRAVQWTDVGPALAVEPSKEDQLHLGTQLLTE